MRVYCLVPLILRDKMITGCQSLGRKERSFVPESLAAGTQTLVALGQ